MRSVGLFARLLKNGLPQSVDTGIFFVDNRFVNLKYCRRQLPGRTASLENERVCIADHFVNGYNDWNRILPENTGRITLKWKRSEMLMPIHDGNKIIHLTDLTNARTVDVTLPPEKEWQLRLIDQAAKGSIEAAADLAEGYLLGSFGEPANKVKARKWAGYAAKRGSEKARQILDQIGAGRL